MILFAILGEYIDGYSEIMISLRFVTFLAMGIIVFSAFKIKRFKYGFPFLQKQQISAVGVLLSIITIFCYVIASNLAVRFDEPNILIIFSLLGIAVCAILIIVWWRKGITRTYKDRLIEEQIKSIDAVMAEKDGRIQELTKSNELLAKIIHRDNKLIPALETMFREFVISVSEIDVEIEEKAAPVLKEFRKIAEERVGVLGDYKKETKKLSLTKVPSLDMMLNYFLHKANINDVNFDVIVVGNIKYLVENYINEEKLRTLVADLLENAIIAVKTCDFKKILLTIGVCDDFYEVCVDDSGIDFEAEVLANLGKTPITTHKETGGSGIGMMTVFEILGETKASLIIKEYPRKNFALTKRVSVRFDGESKFLVELKEDVVKI